MTSNPDEREIARAVNKAYLSAKRKYNAVFNRVITAVKQRKPWNAQTNFTMRFRADMRDLLVLNYLQGFRRSHINASRKTSHNGVMLGNFDNLTRRLMRRTGLKRAELLEQYDFTALRSLEELDAHINGNLINKANQLIRDNVDPDKAIKIISKKFKAQESSIASAFKTQSRIAYHSGKWQAEDEEPLRSLIWGYRYETQQDTRVRDSHEQLQGLTYPRDDPFWQMFYPPNGWQCRCFVTTLYERPKGLPRTGSRRRVNVIPDEGFGVNFGALPGKILSI